MDDKHRRYYSGKYGVMVEETASKGSNKYSTTREASQSEIESMPARTRAKLAKDRLDSGDAAGVHKKRK